MSTISVQNFISTSPDGRVSYRLTRGVFMEKKIPFGKWLLDTRSTKGWSQDILADKAGFKKAYVSKFENNYDLVPPLDTIKAFAEAFGLTLDVPLHAMGY